MLFVALLFIGVIGFLIMLSAGGRGAGRTYALPRSQGGSGAGGAIAMAIAAGIIVLMVLYAAGGR